MVAQPRECPTQPRECPTQPLTPEMREYLTAVRRARLIEVDALDKLLGNAPRESGRDKRDTTRVWQNERQGEYRRD